VIGLLCPARIKSSPHGDAEHRIAGSWMPAAAQKDFAEAL